MPDTALAASHDAERAFAIRSLLASPLLDRDTAPDAWSAVVRHREALVEWFESTCGWTLAVDVTGGCARLAKRSARPDPSRPATRTRGDRLPFDRRRYELLCLLAAELSVHAVTTVGILAGSLGARGFDSSVYGERAAFVDAIRALTGWGIVRVENGDVDAFVSDDRGNALLVTDTGRLHRLLASATPPSRVAAATTAEAIAALVAEPRYASGGGTVADEARLQAIRHTVARAVLDDPVVHYDDLTTEQQVWLANPSGRKWLRDHVREAGFVLEERAEGLLAVDPDAIATDVEFPAPSSTVKQAALLLVDAFTEDVLGVRRLVDLPFASVLAYVERLLRGQPAWARQYQSDDGAERLARRALELLADLGLVVVDGDTARPRPALARYATAPPADGALFDAGGA